jgi:hypothetical protein
MSTRAGRTFVAILLVGYLAGAATFIDWRGTGAAPATESFCDESGGGGFTPAFCVDVPKLQANAHGLSFTLYSGSAAACAEQRQLFSGTICGADLSGLATEPVDDGSGRNRVVCGEGSQDFAPRTCAQIAGVGTGMPQDDGSPAAPNARDDTGLAALHYDVTLDARVARAYAIAADGFVTEIERQFGRPFLYQPAIYVFGTSLSFVNGLVKLFGYPFAAAKVLGDGHGGAFIPGADVIAINWEQARTETILRHEMIHLMVHQIVGQGKLPTWFDEGLATNPWETSLALADVERQRYSLRAAAEQGGLSLHGLTFGGELSLYEYAYAAEAVRSLTRIDANLPNQLLDDVQRGSTFAIAFATRTGIALSRFEADFGSQLVGAIPVPKLIQRPIDSGGNVTFVAYGFTPHSTIQIEITGPSYHLRYAQQNDAFGTYAGTFGSTAPPGVYTLTITGAVRTATIILRTLRG